MKHIYRLTIVLIAFSVSPVENLHAQNIFKVHKGYSWELGAGAGYTNYYGDLSNYRILNLKDFPKVYRFADFNRQYVSRPSFSVLAHKKLNKTVGVLLQANALQFEMSDRYKRKNGELDQGSPNLARSLNFQTNLNDFGVALTFNTNNDKLFSEQAKFYPSFYIGMGISSFSVMGDLYDGAGNPYNYTAPGNINDGDYETNLRDLKTETDDRYSNLAPYLNLGLALNFRINNFLSLAVQSDIKYSGSDYLDDLSKTYKDNYLAIEESYAARPGYNVVDPVTLQRGDNNGVNDIYINNRIVVFYTIRPRKKTKPFKAPVLYSIRRPDFKYTHSTQAFSKNDSLKAHQDSIVKITIVIRDSSGKSDSAFTANKVQYDTLYRSGIDDKLASIQHELIEIKTVIRNQALIPRYSFLKFQIDSVNRLSNKLTAKTTSIPTDRLQVRIYQLQMDSLRNEIQRLLLISQSPTNTLDSALLNFDPESDNQDSPAFTGVKNTGVNNTDAAYSPGLGNLAVLSHYEYDSLAVFQSSPQATWAPATEYGQNMYEGSYNASEKPYNTEAFSSARQSQSGQVRSKNQEDYVTPETSGMAEYIERLERDNRNLSADNDRISRNRASTYSSPAPTVIVPGNDNTTNSREIRELRNDIAFLGAGMAISGTRARREPGITTTTVVPVPVPGKQDSLGQSASQKPDSLTQNLTPGSVMQDSMQLNNQQLDNTWQDSLLLNSLRSDLLLMRKELDSIKRTLANTPVASKPTEYDVSEFPVISVYFATNSATLPSTQANKISPMVTVANKNKSAKISLTGFTDPVGKASANLALAKKRIDYVKTLLITKYGLQEEQLDALEPVLPPANGTKKANPLDRRVDLKFK